MKLKIETRTNTILVVNAMLQSVSCLDFESLPTNTHKAHASILLDLVDKISAKALTIRRQLSPNRKTSLTLKYHEAYVLEFFTRKTNIFPSGSYEQSILTTLANQLNQKLV